MPARLHKLRLLVRRQFLATISVGLFLCAVLGAVLSQARVYGATASTINFQARLMTGAGSIAPDGDYNIEFKLYTASAPDGGETPLQGSCTTNPGATADEDCVWVETRTGGNKVRVANGYLTVNLGGVTAFGTTINWDQDLWITMNVGGTGAPSWDGEMSPRLKLTAVPYAFRAGQLSRLAGSFTGTLEFANSFAQNSTITLPDPGGPSATVCYQGSTSCGFVSGTSNTFIQNGTTVQTNANFNIRSAAIGSVTGVLQGANGQTADLFDVQTWNGSVATTVFGINNVGDLSVQSVSVASGKTLTVAGGATSLTGASGGSSTAVAVVAGAATNKGLTIAGANSQSATLLELQDSSGNINGQFNSLGNQLTLGRIASSGTVTQGKVILADGTTSNFGGTIQVGTTLTNNITYNLPVNATAAQTICTTVASSCSSTYQAAGNYANQQLSNLSGTVALNLSLLPGTTSIDLGSNANAFRDLYLGGTATNNFHFTGTASGTRTFTMPDLSGTLALVQTAGSSTAQTGDINASGMMIAGTAFQGTLVKSSDGTGATNAITVRSGNSTGSGNTGDLAITTGAATSGNSGSITIDSGNASGTKGTITLGGSNAGTISIGNAAVSKTINIGSVGSTNANSTISIATSSTNTTQAITIGASAAGGGNAANNTLVLDAGSTATGIQIGNSAQAHGIQIGASSSANQTIVLGSTNASSTTTIQGGTAAAGGIQLNAATIGLTGTNPFITASGSNVLRIDTAGAAALTLGDTNANVINIANTSTNAATINIANNTTAHTINFANGAATANQLNLNNSSGTTILNGTVRVSNPGAVTANAVALCRDSSTSTIIACDSGASGAPFIQGGNSFGATAVLGTNDASNLQFETVDTVRATFDQSNGLYLGNGVTAASPNNFTVAAAGSSTAGTAGATLTLRGGAGASATTGSAGGDIVIAGGNAAGSGNNAGGMVILQGGLDTNTGTPGGVLVRNSAESLSAFQIQTAASVAGLTVDTTTANLITNHSFETNTTGWAASGSASLSRVTTQYYDNEASLQAAATASNGGARYAFALASGTQYTFSAFVKASAAGANVLELGRFENGSTDSSCTTRSFNTSIFVRYTCTFVTGTVVGSPYLYIKQTDATTRNIWIDGVQLETAGSPTPYRNAKLSVSGSMYINGGSSLAAAADSALTVRALGGGNALSVIGNGETNIAQNIFIVSSGDGSFLAAINEAARNSSFRGGSVFWDSAALQALSDTAGAVALEVKGASGQTANVVRVRDNSNVDMLTIGASGALTSKNTSDGADAFQVQNAGGVDLIDLNTSTTTLSLGVNGATATSGTVTIGTSTGAAQTLTIGSTASTSSTTIQAGTGNLNIGNDSVAKTTTINIGANNTGADVIALGSSHASSTVAIQGGTGGSAVGIQAGSGGTISIGTAANNTVAIGTGAVAGTITIGGTGTTGNIVIGQANSSNSNTISIGSNIGASGTQTINIGTSATASSTTNVTLGSTVAGTTILQSAGGVRVTTVGAYTSNAVAICRDSSTTTLIACDANSGAPFIQGGNSFGATAVLGTNESQGLNIRTNSTTRMSFVSTGGISIPGIATADELEIGDNFTDANDSATRLNIGSTGGNSIIRVGESNLLFGAVYWDVSPNIFQLSTGFNNVALRLQHFGGSTTVAGDAIFQSGLVANTVDSATAFQVQNIADVNFIHFDAVTGTVNLGVTGSIATSSTVNVATSTGAAQAVTLGSTAAGSSTVLQAGSTGNLIINTAGTVRATFTNANTVYLGNGVTAAAPNAFMITGTGSTTTAVAGGALTIQGGSATVGNANGGSVTLAGGTGFGSGVKGLVVVDTATFSTATTQSSGSSANVTQANIDSFGAIVLNATASSLVFTLSDPTLGAAAAGRLIYVIAANGTNDFTLRANTGEGTGIEQNIAMRQNTTATMVWTGTNWTAAGASSSTTLQAAYDNTLSSAGGAEIVLNNSATSDGLTVRNSASNPIIGAILEAQTSIGSSLFSVNNNATEYATNGGAETAGASSSTFPANTWDTTTGGTVDRWTTAGDNIATGQASVRVQTTTTNHGARNRISASLTSGLTYTVSFAVRGAVNFSTLQVLYSPDGTTTGTTQCATAQTVTSGIWTRISCTFIASGTITSGNSILIRQTDSTARTFYVDNLSININASATFAADGSVDNAGAFTTNWTDFDGGTGSTTITRELTVIYDTSASTAGATTANPTQGIRNNMAITPSINTQYLVSFYARSTNTMTSSLAVGFLPAGGTSAPTGTAACTDYNTQSLAANTWTKITCLFTTTGTAISDPDLVIYQTDSTARTIYVDALSITLNTNNSNNVQVGGANRGGPVTLFTLDRSNSAPIAANNEAYLGSMYYDTSSGRIQCYEADGWGACGAAPDNIVNLNPEYAGAVLNGSGVGTMTADFCGNGGGLSVNTTLCTSGEAKNFYRWTSPQATQQTYSIYVSYQLPATFNGFSSDDTVRLTARVDNTTNASVTYEMYKSVGGSLSQCGTGETNVITGGGGSANTWYTYGINGNEATGCSFSSSSASGFVIFKINVKANSNANAYVSTLSFTTTGR